MEKYIEQTRLTYELIGEQYYPLLELPEQKEIFEKFDDCWSEYASYAEEAIFTYAFKLGIQIAMAETERNAGYGSVRTVVW